MYLAYKRTYLILASYYGLLAYTRIFHAMLYSLSNVECPYLTDPANGSLAVFVGNAVGDTATYICNRDFELAGARTLACQSDGTWNDPPPTCQMMSMKNPLYRRIITVTKTSFHKKHTVITQNVNYYQWPIAMKVIKRNGCS